MVISPLVTIEWLLVEGNFETEARSLGMRLARQGCCRPLLLYSKVFLLYSPYSLTVKYHFLYSKITNKNTKEKL